MVITTSRVCYSTPERLTDPRQTEMSDNMNEIDEITGKIKNISEEANEETKKKITGELHNIIEKYSMKQEEGKIFNDSIHGHIELHPLLVKIIDTPQFQRLRNIKQLGGVYWVYPGASHNRFEHSIGVAYLAGCLVNSLQENQPELNITNRDKLCVQIAGLSRDLGHGPLSKMFEKLFIPEVLKVPEGSKQHSELTVKMFHHMIKENGLKTVMERYGMKPDEDCPTIENMIRGSSGTDGERDFLYEITENKLNGVDVNKFDYFKRDCHHLGLSNSFDHQRLMKFARVCEVDGKNHICFSLKEADNIYEMFRTHYNLHRQAYQHKTVSIIEIMIKNAFIEANEHLNISAAIGDIKEYSKLTDKIFEDILYSTNDELKNARKILQDVVKRRLPKCVGEGRLPKIRDEKDKQAIQNQLKGNWKTAVDKWNQEKKTNLNSDDFIVDVIEMDHGMKEKNPLDTISFYSKSNPDHAFKIRNYQVSSFMPKLFDEKHVRVYYNKNLEGGVDKNILRSVKQCFVQWGNNRFGLPGCITLYEKENFQGRPKTFDRECPDLQTKRYRSYRVHSGTWIFYCEDKIKDVKHIVKPGDSGNLDLWTSTEESTKTWSCKMHSCVIALFEENSRLEVLTDISPPSVFNRERKVLSYLWFSGIWTCKSSEKMYLLSEPGHCEWSSETIIQLEFQAEGIVIINDEE